MAYRDPDNPPRWWVTVSAVGAFVVGALVMINEALYESGERPALLGFAYLLMSGAPVVWALERFRR